MELNYVNPLLVDFNTSLY